uniref:Uncharacterized protein n=1 Tax=Lotharella globosa TaxID=91324 RepID=A0A7S4E191_9EUKA|mmetsp:Transcript_20634/g.41649  ORF Transcript_20634/g.41649 Transcript_20634/m.41649 type:complete len:159 (+) Transcript_20634:53-529(+)
MASGQRKQPTKADWRVHPKELPKEDYGNVMKASYSASFQGEGHIKEAPLRNAAREKSVMSRAEQIYAKQIADAKLKQEKEALLYQFGDRLKLNKNSIPVLQKKKELKLANQGPITVWNSSGNPKAFSGVSEVANANAFARSTKFSKPITERVDADDAE